MRVQIEEIGQGLHPGEVVVSVKTIDGTEVLTIDRRSLVDGTIDVGYPIKERESDYVAARGDDDGNMAGVGRPGYGA